MNLIAMNHTEVMEKITNCQSKSWRRFAITEWG